MKITLELNKEIVAEFKELPMFWYTDEKGNLIKPTIQETLIKYIINCINERRTGLATSRAAVNTNLLKEKDIKL